jgi:4-hydroxy-L-threonine phosphate dehydrogenase PdxA
MVEPLKFKTYGSTRPDHGTAFGIAGKGVARADWIIRGRPLLTFRDLA